MARTSVIVLGGSGMLGSMAVDRLSRDAGLEVTATVRSADEIEAWAERLPDARWDTFAGADDLAVVEGHDWVVNAVGVIKPFIRDDDAAEVENAILVNGLLPHRLAAAAGEAGARVLQIATDCVYSGVKGDYSEDDLHDALDVYGKTKSLGEVPAPHVVHLRCSIVGPESGRSRSLLEWFLSQPRGATLSGYANHRWNGVSTLHFARVCHGAITGAVTPRPRHHVVPTGDVTKLELLQAFARAYGRDDLTIEAVDAPTVVDRTLSTDDPEANRALWRAAGYDEPPTVPQMVEELARFDYRPVTERPRAAVSG